MLDVILGFIFSMWVTWLLLKLIASFDEDIEQRYNFFAVVSYIIDLGMAVIIAIWLIFRFRG